MSRRVRSETPGAWSRRLLWLTFVLVVSASFLISLAVNAPARLIAQRLDLTLANDAVSGTLMHGQIEMDGSFVLRWNVKPIASLIGLNVTAGVTLTGPETDLAGDAALDLSAYRFGPVSGQADARVLQAIFPLARLHCAGPIVAAAFRVDVTRKVITGTGTLRSGELSCDDSDNQTKVPAMTFTFVPNGGGTDANVMAGSVPVLDATSHAGRLAVVLHREGAALFPGLPSSADSSIELPLSVVFP